MSQLAMSTHGLSKRYRAPSARTQESEPSKGIGLLRWGLRSRRRDQDFWIDAVSNVSFEVGVGEPVGLIGRNGAGKSTLLKLLSRVTRPTSGRAEVYGRVGALLEVGTGFHPELTGRENTFLSGAILGMSRRDIGARFDEIVAFAEVAPFIDMPVKHYSSGMYARLGFAVAAFLKPAILIVDEILAVGDLLFQAKCLSHMRKLSNDGTTVLFVSHNLLAISDFCPRAIVLSAGRMVFDGATPDAIAVYRRSLRPPDLLPRSDLGHPVNELRINGEIVDDTFVCRPNDRLQVELDIERPADSIVSNVELNLVIETADGRVAMHLRNDLGGVALPLGPGRSTLTIDIHDLPLVPNNYSLWLRVVDLDATMPMIWDTPRLLLVVTGEQRLESIAQPVHEFGYRPHGRSAGQGNPNIAGVRP